MCGELFGTLHHIELYVSDLQRSVAFWQWLLEELGYALFQSWESGCSYKKGKMYLVFVQVERKYLDIPYHRKRAGMNHLAFHGRNMATVDKMAAQLQQHGVTMLYGGAPLVSGDSYAVYFEDPDRIKVEITAPYKP